MLFILLAVLSLTLQFSFGNPVRLRQVSVDVGSPAVLPCEAKDSADVLWQFEREGSDPPIELASYGEVINGHVKRFTLLPSYRGLHNLMINKTQLSDAGIYHCIEDNGAGTKHFVVLIVIGNGMKPRTVVVSEGSSAVLPCEPKIKENVMWEFEDTSRDTAVELVELASWGEIISGREERFTLASSANGNYSLVVRKTESRDAGVYICTEDNGAGKKHYVILKIVVATNEKEKNPSYPSGFDGETNGNTTLKPYAEHIWNVSKADPSSAWSNVSITVVTISTLIAVIVVVMLLLLTTGKKCCRRLGQMSSKKVSFSHIPNELCEVILKKSATLLYLQLQKQSTDADNDKLAVTTICSVNSKWDALIVERQFNRNQLRQTFNYLRSPCPRRLPEPIHLVEENSDINSFTILGNYIYTVRGSQTRELQVFDGVDYRELHTQILLDVIHPSGLIGSQANDCLYLGDSISRCIWTLTPWKPGSTCELNTFYSVQAPGHSVKSLAAADDGRLIVLITVEEFSGKTWTGKLDVLERDGNRQRAIPILEDIVNPSCVAITQENTFVISGGKAIWLLDEDGRKLSTFSEGIEFPCSIRFNPNNKTLFAADSGSLKVLLLAIRGEKLVFRKLVKKWDDWRTIQANRSFVANECDPLLAGGANEDHAAVSDRFEVRNVPTVRFDVGCSDDGVQQQFSCDNSNVDIPQDVARAVDRYRKRPVRVVSDCDKLIVGLNSGEILAYRLH